MRFKTTLPLLLAGLVTGAVGCGEELFQSLVDFRDATESDCEHGGTVVVAGLDANENGVLDEDEIDENEPICNGGPGIDGEQGIPGTNALLRTFQEPAGDNCADGGVKVEIGIDDDGDGTLDDGEITATNFVCNGARGPAGFDTLVRTLPGAPSCGEFGGLTIQSGLDDNRDGVLDDTEVDATEVVCNGEDGIDSLVDIAAEPAGENCPVGGQQITSGLDEDRDGQLTGVEINDVVYVCDPIDNLVSVRPELPGSDCPDGGNRIDAGLDLDGSGTLEEGEIDTTTFVCSGDDGFSSLVVVTAEPVGDNCAEGGSRVDSGLDVNEDDVLDPSEITSTQFVCDGSDGLDGADGARDLVRVATVPPGVTCPTGGIRFESGPDVNDDGVLQGGELTSISVVCNGEDGEIGIDSLVNVTAVAPGAECAEGGQRIEVGSDLDDNGVLDVAEVASTTVVCNGTGTLPFAILDDPSLPDALAGSPYEAPLVARGGTGGDYTWTVSSGALPGGLVLDPTGTPGSRISGVPTAGGTFTFTVQVTDFFGQAADKEFTVFVQPPVLEVETFVVPRPSIGASFSATLTATGGAPPYSWTIADGVLPAGLSLNAATGALSGTPTDGLPSSVLFEVQDSLGDTAATRVTFHDEPRWAAFAGDFLADGVYELGLNSIEGGIISASTTLNPAPVSGGDLGQSTAPSFSDVKFAANGDRVSFTGDFDLDLSEEIWWVDLSGTTPGTATKANVAFTTGDQDVTGGGHEWSSDGRYLAYRADDAVNSEFNLFLVDTFAATPSPVQVNPPLQTNQDVNTGFQFSPDGTLLAYEADHATTDVTDLFVVDVTAAVPTPVNVSNNSATGDTSTFQWSPDSQSLLYTNDGLTDGIVELFLASVPGGVPGPSVVVNGTFASTTDVLTGTNDYGFSPDGSRIFYMADPNVDGLTELFVVDVNNLGVPRQVSATGLTNASQDVELAIWAPDSKALVYAHDATTLDVMELWLGDATGTLSGFPVQLSGPMTTDGDIGQTTSPSNNDVLVDPAGRGVFYAADETTSAREDLYFASFDSPGSSVLLTTNFSASSDVNSFLVAQDGSLVVFNGDPTSAVDELYAVDTSGAVPGAPQLANKPLVSGGDVDTSVTSSDYFIVGDGEAVVYVADADTDGVDESYYTELVGGAAGVTTTLNPPMVASGDATIVYREN